MLVLGLAPKITLAFTGSTFLCQEIVYPQEGR